MFKFNILKNLVQKINNIRYQKKLLDSLSPGDLVWAKMPLSREELNKVEENHRIRPYLIMHKDKFNVYAYQSSSKQLDKLNNYQEYCIHKIRYKQNKDSFLNLTKLYKIPFTNLRKKHITLNELDLKNIQKRLLIQREKSIYKFATEIRILEGDVIRINKKLYYVYASNNIFLYCITIFKKCPKDNKKYKNIIINNKTYYTTFKEKINFKRTTKMAIINIAYQSEIDTIIDIKNGFDYNQKILSNSQKKIIPKSYESFYENGTVFQIGKTKIVYLFKYKNVHYGVDLLMYKIIPKTIPIFDIEKRQILEILPLDKYMKIVEFLSLNNVQPLKEINRLYSELRMLVYK